MEKESYFFDRSWFIIFFWLLVFMYNLIFTDNLNHCDFYEGKINNVEDRGDNYFYLMIEDIHDYGIKSRRFFMLSESDYELLTEKSKIGDVFQLWYNMKKNNRIKILQLKLNNKMIVEYSWWKHHWLTLIFAIFAFSVCFIVPIIFRDKSADDS